MPRQQHHINNRITPLFRQWWKAILTSFALLMLSSHALISGAAHAAPRDQEIIRGFNLTVFGAEFAPMGIQSNYVRKYRGTVRFYIHNLSKKNRNRQVSSFIRSLNSQIRGLKTRVVAKQAQANFNVYVVDRKDYVSVVRKKIYRRASAAAPGNCLVRSVFTRKGMVRSDAIIVSDEGEALFNRCVVEEILQGLGPLNDHPSLSKSVFNDRSRHTRFTAFDRYILNMLYDPRVKNGDSKREVQRVLPAVLRDVKKRLR